jgi:carbonic anhydrase
MRPTALALSAASLLTLAACARPDPRVEDLRQQVAGLEAKISGLEKQRAAAAPSGHGHGPADPRQEPQTALNLLVAGNAAFVSGRGRPADLGSSRRGEVAKGQKPYAAILGCADSRVPPEHLFNAGLGDLFIVRDAGNVADEMAVASIEYAVAHLGTRLVVILGHSACGAVKAACADAQDTPAVISLVARIRPAVAEAQRAGAIGADLPDKAMLRNAALQKRQLLERSAFLREQVEGRQIRLVTAVYQLESGTVGWLDDDGLDSAAAQPRTAEPSLPAPAAAPAAKPAAMPAAHH